MIKEIKYNGYTANLSDYECPDGDLAIAMGLLPENGALHPIYPPQTIATLPLGCRVLCLHETAAYKHVVLFIPNLTTVPPSPISPKIVDPPSVDDGSTDDDDITGGSGGFSGDEGGDSGENSGDINRPSGGDDIDEDENQSSGDNTGGGTEDTEENITTHKGAVIAIEYETLSDLSFVTYKMDGEERVYIYTPYFLIQHTDTQPTSVTAMGNTLIILYKDAPYKYAIWKNQNYHLLSSHPPFVPLQFALQGSQSYMPFEITGFTVDNRSYSGGSYSVEDGSLIAYDKISEEISNKSLTPEVLAAVNKFVADTTYNKDEGKFVFPFLVRYAIRFYDGTLTQHSCPVLMIPNSHIIAELTAFDYYATVNTINVADGGGRINAIKAQLFHRILEVPKELNDWKDLIQGIDIYISAPIYTYDQNGYVKGWTTADSVNPYPQKRLSVCNESLTLNVKDAEETFYTPDYQLILPTKEIKTIQEDVESCSTFYKIYSIPFNDIKTTDLYGGWLQTLVKGEVLQSLTSREVMTDDFNSHHDVIAQSAMAYNSRLNLANITEVVTADVPINCQWAYLNNPKKSCEALGIHLNVNNKEEKIADFIKGEFASLPRYLFFPHPAASKIRFVDDSANIYDFPLKEHSLLNGAVWFRGFGEDNAPEIAYSFYDYLDEIRIKSSNKIFTSEVNNPFTFPMSGRNAVSSGTILGLSAVVKALSQGQFGQFPLYAFTEDGVWALSISSTGAYESIQPVTRDVCTNVNSITQTDDAVLFVTDRGVMHLSGAQSICISDILNAQGCFTMADLPKADKLIGIFNSKADESEQITLDNITLLPFDEFLRSCRMVYDYTNQHIIVYNALVRYAYVFSLKSKSWGMMRSDIVDNVNSYPEALAMADGAKLVDFSKPMAENITALIITRPFKMDDPNSFKTINTVIQRGMFRSTHVQQVLYGSNDLIHWHTVWSSVDKIMRGFRGTPYKAYRLALVCRFDKAESLYGCTVVFEPRKTNQVR